MQCTSSVKFSKYSMFFTFLPAILNYPGLSSKSSKTWYILKNISCSNWSEKSQEKTIVKKDFFQFLKSQAKIFEHGSSICIITPTYFDHAVKADIRQYFQFFLVYFDCCKYLEECYLTSVLNPQKGVIHLVFEIYLEKNWKRQEIFYSTQEVRTLLI